MQEIIFGTTVMLLMAFFIVVFVLYYQRKQSEQREKVQEMENAFQKKLLEVSVAATEAERRRMAQDLHDGVGALLSLTKLSLNTLHTRLSNDKDSQLSQQVRDSLDETMAQVRRISRELVPTTLEHFGLPAALNEFVTKNGQTNNVRVTFGAEGDETQRLEPKIELMLYRITQELVNNAIKHSSGTSVHVQLALSPHPLELWVEDNGRGFDINKIRQEPHNGLGLDSIEARLRIINGNIAYETVPQHGCRAKVAFKAA